MNPRRRTGLLLAFFTSLAVHGVAYASLTGEHRQPGAALLSEVTFELPPLAEHERATDPPSPLPEPTPSKLVEPAASKPTGLTRTLAVRRELVPAQAPPPASKDPHPALDLSGVTLTNDSGSGFATPVGDGSALRGPIGPSTNRLEAAAATSVSPSVPKPPALVAASDLSERPKPPSLTAILRANYPEEARQRGLRGSASLRARIDSDGVIRWARLLSETSAGFGSACQRTVLGSHWSAPRDKNGGAVATEIVYTCHFEVDQ